jgi:hypothetical protein
MILWLASTLAAASEYRGEVTFGGLPVPGATVTATRGDTKLVSITNQGGAYSFADLIDGTWTIEIEMQCFSTIKQDVVIAPNISAATWELKLLPLDQIKAESVASASLAASAKGQPTAAIENIKNKVAAQDKNRDDKVPQDNNKAAPIPTAQADPDSDERASNGLLINGSMNNGAASPFAQFAAFGNNRNSGKGLYNGGIGVIVDNSVLNARPFSFSGQSSPKAAYNRVTGIVTLGGPLKIPHLFEHGPNFFVGYQWSRNRNATTQSALVPNAAERNGDFSQAVSALGQPSQIFDPATGLPFPGNVIPQGRISPQAQALLNLYPQPNLAGHSPYNYQIPIVDNMHQDALQSRLDKSINPKNQVNGNFALQSTRTSGPDIFGFLDTTDVLGINSGINWSHRFSQRLFLNLGYRFSRLSTRASPFWENRANVSGNAGITGNNQDPRNWGPPKLVFSSGLAGLSDEQSSFDRNETDAWSYSMLWSHNRHNIKFGGDFRRQQSNYLFQQDPRGTFTFTGAATRGGASGPAAGGSDFADFLLGIPDTSAIAFGNADKYLRESVYDVYINDDWRMSPEFSVNAGIRWEYGAPITELHDRLVNLDITPGFGAAAPVVAGDAVGALTGQRYPNSLVRPDKLHLEPRIGISWRPISGSSVVVRAGYGIYSDTSVYQTIALEMAQQAPLSKSLRVANSAACPLTLANAFTCPAANTFAVDPNFRIGYVHNWQLSVQRDLPASLQLIATYLGVKGTRGLQEFLPNTFAPNALNPCPACPTGFAYITSNGDSTREAGQIQLRRRLHNGFTAMLQYTFSKSVDDDSLLGGQGAAASVQNPQANPFATIVSTGGGQGRPTIAQNWLDLGAERGPSTFDQRHLLNLQMQYTSGMGLGGGTLATGWQGALLKGWTFITQITAGSGLPETPIFLAVAPGTGVTGSIRPDRTSAHLYAAPSGLFVNPAAYAAPQPGQWGNAGRDSITGPAQFALNASIGRTFRLDSRFNLDLRMDSTNLLNHVTFTNLNTTINSTQFGLPIAANPMRSMQTSLRLRF